MLLDNSWGHNLERQKRSYSRNFVLENQSALRVDWQQSRARCPLSHSSKLGVLKNGAEEGLVCFLLARFMDHAGFKAAKSLNLCQTQVSAAALVRNFTGPQLA